MSKEEALECPKLQEIDEKQADRVYELVGGHMMHLKSIADEVMRTSTFESMCIVTCDAENG